MMTHGAVVAREYRVPALAGVHRDTERLLAASVEPARLQQQRPSG